MASSGMGMPSAHGSEHKARDMEESRRNYRENMDRIFGEREKPWYERRDDADTVQV